MNGLTIVVPYRNAPAALARLLRTLPTDIPVIVVDDASEPVPGLDDLSEGLSGPRPGVQLIRRSFAERGYFSGAVNTGIAACTTDVLVLNQDVTQVSPAWIAELDRLRKEYAIIGDGVMNHPAWPKGYIQGTVMFMRRDAIAAIGGFNERGFPLWGATAEWQARACRRGYKALPMDTSAWFAHDRSGRYGSSIAEFVAADPAHADWAKRTPPLVSVILACYNYGRYLTDAINSLRGGMTSLGEHPGQTFAAWEAIIVDDCSSDDTPAIAQSLADAWQGIRYIRLPKNVGTAAAYNVGIKASYGRYFMMLSADDMLEPGALDAFYRILEDDPGAVAYCDQQLFSDGKRGKVWTMKEYDFEPLLDRNHVPAGIMASKDAWRAVGGYPEAFRFGREDWAMAVALGRAGHCGVRIPEPLYLYRRAGQNRSATNGTADWRAFFVNQMRETFPDLYRGDRPMGCCGGSKRAARTVQRAPGAVKMAMRAGEDGLTMIEYTGGNAGKSSWWGPTTGTRYEFGGSKRVGYVDNRDLAGMLDVAQGRKLIFRRYAQPAQPVVKMERPEVMQAIAALSAAMPTGLKADAQLQAGESVTADAMQEAFDALKAVPVEAQAVLDATAVLPAKPKRKRKAKHV
jgi:GT2 family glycosyltransferase